MRSNLTQLIIRGAVAIGLSVVGVSAIAGTVEPSAAERAPITAHDGVTGDHESDSDAALSDRLRLRSYFLDGLHDRLK
jgi:hypothetical protein